MKTAHRFLTLVCAVASLASFAGSARAQINDTETGFYYEPMRIRHTNAVTLVTPQELNWGRGGPGTQQVIGFADSTVIRQTGTNLANVAVFDTSVAYPMTRFRFPPGYQYRPASRGMRAAKEFSSAGPSQGYVDSAYVDTTDATPWLAIRIVQDTLSYGFTSNAVFDTFAVGAQVSYDNGLNWLTVSGTPTRAFYAQYGGTAVVGLGADGLALPTVIGVEPSPGADIAEIRFRCYPQLWEQSGTAFIVDRDLCACSGALVRFIIKLTDGDGQFQPWLGYWRHPSNADLN